jgi:acetylornithine deacetylase/succinyl-diaminopimelate desuccinylase-like protein
MSIIKIFSIKESYFTYPLLTRYNKTMTTTYKSLLSEFISFKSISTDPQYKSEITKTTNFLKEKFEQNNFKVEIIEGFGNPIVIAHYENNKDDKTCLIYGHYDVQPAEKSEGWRQDPFTVEETDERIYARGAIDNKGQVLVHIATIFDLIRENKLAYNITFMIEGDEETGSPHLEAFIKRYPDKLKADVVMISDGEITGKYPVIELGFRGGFNATLTMQSANNDLHSGIYGGATPNAAYELSVFLANLYDENNQITIPQFYDDVEPIEKNLEIPFDQEEYEKITGAKTLKTEPEYNFHTQIGLRPTIQVTGIHTGYTGEGYRNSIPAKATAKINFRLVKNQNPHLIAELFKNYCKKMIPNYITYTLENTDPYDGIKLDVNNDYIKKTKQLLRESYEVDPLEKYSGGGLPIVTYFDNILKVPQILVPLANEDCNMHGVHENFDKKFLEKALTFSKKFFSK